MHAYMSMATWYGNGVQHNSIETSPLATRYTSYRYSSLFYSHICNCAPPNVVTKSSSSLGRYYLPPATDIVGNGEMGGKSWDRHAAWVDLSWSGAM